MNSFVPLTSDIISQLHNDCKLFFLIFFKKNYLKKISKKFKIMVDF